MFILKSLVSNILSVAVLLVGCFGFTSPAVAECTQELKQELSLAGEEFNTRLKLNLENVSEALIKIQNFAVDYKSNVGWLSVPLVRDLFWTRTRNYTYSDIQRGVTKLYPLVSDYNILSDKVLKLCEASNVNLRLALHLIPNRIKLISSYNILLSVSKSPGEFTEYLLGVQEELNELSVEISR